MKKWLYLLPMGALIAFCCYETAFSPSFMMQFVTAGFILCAVSEVFFFATRKLKTLRDLLYTAGISLSVPAVIMYATGDDALNRCVLFGILLSIVLCTVYVLIRAKRQKPDVISLLSVWSGFFAVSFTLLCAFTNTYLFFYAAALAAVHIVKLSHDAAQIQESGCQPEDHAAHRKKNIAEGLAVAAVVVLLIAAFHDPYTSKPLNALIRLFGHGPEILYENESVTTDGSDSAFLPGASWLDMDGNPIQAHGGQILRMPVPDGDTVRERYVWTGEDKSSGHFGNCVAVYVSDDLLRWDFKGDVLRSIENRTQLDEDPYFTSLYAGRTEAEKDTIFACINTQSVTERPKMLYNALTQQYVIWFHSDDATEKNSYKYDVGMAGVAVSDSPFGPFRFLQRQRLNICPSGQIDCFPASKGEARDMNLFLDSDGTAYIVYTSENNKTLYISRLDETFTRLSAAPEEAVCGEDFIRLFPSAMREVPVLFRGDNGRYYLLSSSTTGWMSNQARLWSADTIFGSWKNEGNPFQGKGRNLSFDTQCTSVFRTENGNWIYYGDRWKQDDLADSRYIWLPLTMEGDRIRITWQSRWE